LRSAFAKEVPDAPKHPSSIQIHNGLAAYYLLQARQLPRERQDWLFKATQCYNESDKIDHDNSSTWLGKALLQTMNGKYEQALYVFRRLLEKSPNMVPALLGKAMALYHQKKYSDALVIYQKLLRLNCNMRPDPRVGKFLYFCVLFCLGYVIETWIRNWALSVEFGE
jgi:tetratricopeptide (TPR) repeat protein